jgi:cobalt-zinc-cadmium efflux system membrane fusion protein
MNLRSALLLCLLAPIVSLSACGKRDIADEAPGHAEKSAHGDHEAEHEARRTRIDAVIAGQAGIRIAPAGPGTIRDEHEVQGLLTPIEGRHATPGRRVSPGRSDRSPWASAMKCAPARRWRQSKAMLSLVDLCGHVAAGVVPSLSREPVSASSRARAARCSRSRISRSCGSTCICSARCTAHHARLAGAVTRLSDGVTARPRWIACCRPRPPPARARWRAPTTRQRAMGYGVRAPRSRRVSRWRNTRLR